MFARGGGIHSRSTLMGRWYCCRTYDWHRCWGLSFFLSSIYWIYNYIWSYQSRLYGILNCCVDCSGAWVGFTCRPCETGRRPVERSSGEVWRDMLAVAAIKPVLKLGKAALAQKLVASRTSAARQVY